MSAGDRSATHETRHYASKVFRLELARTARAFEPPERIWDRELRRMFKLVRGHTNALGRWQRKREAPSLPGEAEPTDPESSPVLSMAIFGTYGSGKSSLLKTFVREARLDRDRRDLLKPDPSLLYSLPVIEPNLRASDDHFLYAFLATALEEDMRRRGQDEDRRAAGSQSLSPVQHAFERLSEYLQVIDARPRDKQYDPLGVSLERLDRHTSDFRLRQEMAGFIDTLAENLAGRHDNSVLILPVDDADMSLEKLVATLDTYRRYLLHPRLIPVFAFTGRLSEELLQVYHGRELSGSEQETFRPATRQQPARDSEHEIEHLNITEHLAVQYLVKLFPIRNRIRIGYAPVRVQAAQYQTAEGTPLRVIYLLEIASYLLFGHPQWPTVPRVRLALRPATLRRQIQVLDAMHEARVDRLVERNQQADTDVAVCIRRLDGPAGGDGGARASAGDATEDRRQDGTEDGRGDGADGSEALSWVEIFHQAGWSLLNVHRDVLRELHLHVEELYSWTPRGLRREILRILLALDSDRRQMLLKRWRFRIEDRRGQVLSLLAVLAFRPELPHEEYSGEDPDQVLSLVRRADASPKNPAAEEEIYRFPARRDPQYLTVVRAGIWFLELWTGFYLPQLLAQEISRSAAEPAADGRSGDPDEEPVLGVGWNLRSGPIHAFFAMAAAGEVSATGMMRLSAKEFGDELKRLRAKSTEAPKTCFYIRMLIDIWCFYGFHRGEAWVAVSLWRGLGLLGQILDDYQRFRSSWRLGAEGEPEEHLNRIKQLLRNHCAAARRAGVYRRGEDVSFVEWDMSAPAENDRQKRNKEATEQVFAELAAAIRCWLVGWTDYQGNEQSGLHSLRIDPIPNHCQWSKQDRFPMAWKRSFLRRLHGEYMMGEFLVDLDSAYFKTVRTEEEVPLYTAGRAVEAWRGVLAKYFDGLQAVEVLDEPPASAAGAAGGGATSPPTEYSFAKKLFEDCPLFLPWSRASGDDEIEDWEPSDDHFAVWQHDPGDRAAAEALQQEGETVAKIEEHFAELFQNRRTAVAEARKFFNTLQRSSRDKEPEAPSRPETPAGDDGGSATPSKPQEQ